MVQYCGEHKVPGPKSAGGLRNVAQFFDRREAGHLDLDVIVSLIALHHLNLLVRLAVRAHVCACDAQARAYACVHVCVPGRAHTRVQACVCGSVSMHAVCHACRIMCVHKLMCGAVR